MARPSDRPAAARGWPLWPSWALVLGVPLVVAPAMHENFRLPKDLVAGTLALLALLFLVPRLARRGAPVAWRFFAAVPAVGVALPLVAAAIVSVVAGDQPAHGAAALPSLAIAAALLVGWSVGLDDAERWRLLRATVVPGVLLSLLALVQFAVANPFRFEGDLRQRMELTSLAGNPFDLAAFLILPLVVAQAQLTAPGPRRRWWVLALVPMVATLFVAQTFTVLAAAAVASVAFWAPRLPRRRLVAGLAGAAVVATIAVVAVAPLRERVALKLRNLRQGDVQNLLSGRLEGWRGAAWMLAEHPLTGVGHGAFRAEYGAARLALAERGVRFSRIEEPYFTRAHNDPLQAAAEWGWVGVVALVAAAVVAVRAWRRGPPPGEGDDTRRAHAAARAALLGLVLLSLVNFPFHLALVAYPALLAAATVLRPRPPDAGAEEATGEAPAGVDPRLLAAVLGVLLVVALGLQARRAAAVWSASRELETVERRTAAALRMERLPNLVVRDNLRKLERAEAAMPAAVEVAMSRAAQYLISGRPHAALRGYREAVALEERGEAWLNVARAHMALGEVADARAAVDRALLLDRNLRREAETLLAALPEAP